MSFHRGRAALGQLVLAVLTPLILACAPTGDSAQPARERYVLANVHPPGYPTAEGLLFFEEQVRLDPVLSTRLEIDLQLAGVLGNEKETLEKLGFGALQMVCSSVAPLAEFSSGIGVLALPYLFRDSEHLWTVLDGEIGRELLAELEADGYVGLAWYDAGARSFYNRRRPIRSLDDLAGLKIRVQQSEILRATVEALGASPVAMGFKDVYTNLHTGAIDGAENNLPSYRSERHFEVAGHYSYDRHSMIPDLLIVRRDDWVKLGAEEQAALRRAASASAVAQRGFWREYAEAARRELEAAGAELHEIDDLAPFRQAVEPVYARHADRWRELVERIRAVGAAP